MFKGGRLLFFSNPFSIQDSRNFERPRKVFFHDDLKTKTLKGFLNGEFKVKTIAGFLDGE